MIGRLLITSRVLTKTVVPRRLKVTRPDFPRYNHEINLVIPSGKEVKLWELVVAIGAMSLAMFGPTMYLMSDWKNFREPED